ncbi:MAG TPA: hypothetical protein ENN23_03970 [Deltaproteobacteria bacterium]|nr:hypothetical protein [Deltaproteobacteria bacterium]
MGKNKLPDYKLKQKLLYVDNTKADVLKSYGDLFYDKGYISDALDFYKKAGDMEGLEKIKSVAFESGDVMLFEFAAKALDIELSPSDWKSIGQKAAGLKKYTFAKHALEKADDQEGLNSIKKIMETENSGKEV